MVIQKRYCDRCRKEIDENYEELSLGSDLNYELCNDCYYDIHDIVTLWLNNTRPCDNCQHEHVKGATRIVHQVISVFKHDLDIQIQLEATFKSFKNAQNFIQRKCRDCVKIDGPRYNFGDFGEYIASYRIDGIPSGVEEFYIKTCPILDGKTKEEEE